MTSSRLCILLVVTISATLRVAHLLDVPRARDGLGNCSLPNTAAELGELVAESFLATDGGPQPQTVRVFEYRILSQASAATRDTVSSFSAVVFYECSGSECGAGPVNHTDQFQYDCAVRGFGNSGSFTPPSKTGNRFRTANVDFQRLLMVTPSNQCGDSSEVNVTVNLITRVTDSDTHCVPCLPDCVGLGKCLGLGTRQCCNFYENDQCVVNCTTPLVPDAEFDCGCGPLDPPNTVMTLFTNFAKIDSVATQTCDASLGYSPSGSSPVTRTCTQSGWDGVDIQCQLSTCHESALVTGPGGSFVTDPLTAPFEFGDTATFSCAAGYELEGDPVRQCGLNGWSGSNPTCRKLQCSLDDLMVPNGGFSVDSDPPVVGSVATFTCDANFDLQGVGTRTCEESEGTGTGWSGDNPACTGAEVGGSSSPCGAPCIVGIVLAIVGVLILAAILAGVAYAVYSYMNHPDTKLAKYDADNINGVAKDNPLYVDPEAVVGAGDGAEAA